MPRMHSILKIWSVALIAAFTAALLATPASAQERGKYIVVLEDSIEHPGEIARVQTENRNGKLGFVYRHSIKGYSVELPTQAVANLRLDARVNQVTVDHKVEIDEATTPTGIRRVFAPANPFLLIDETDSPRADVDVAVLDTGVDHEHPDLDVEMRVNCSWPSAYFCDEDTGIDDNSHGTHVAGTIAALDNNLGVVGIAPGARIWSVKVLEENGTGLESEVVAGIDWVAAHSEEIEVVNMSIGCADCPSGTKENAITASVKKGLVYAVSAGNDNRDVKGVSAGQNPDVIAVSAVADYDGEPGGKQGWTCENKGLDDQKASFSNYGSMIDVAAPGVCILSTTPGGNYGLKNGTSMASPHVAGAAALLAIHDNPENAADVTAIRETIRAEGNFNWTDTSPDGIKEPLLDVSGKNVFSIIKEAPQATTEAATEVKWKSAKLNATIDPNGVPSQYYFQYGATTQYGQSTAKKSSSSAEPLKVSHELTGLTPGTTYHYRVAMDWVDGKVAVGSDKTFTTPNPHVPRVEAESYPAPLSGSSFNTFTGKGGAIKCNTATWTGQLAAASREVTLNPQYGSCSVAGLPATPVLNSCHYTLLVKNANAPYSGRMGIECEAENDAIEFNVVFNGNVICNVRFPAQEGLESTSIATPIGSGSSRTISLGVSLQAVKYTLTGGSCGAAPGTYTDGSLTGTGTLLAKNQSNVQIGTYVTGEQLPLGMFVSAPAGGQVGLAAEVYALKFAGSGLETFKTTSGSFKCKDTAFTGTMAGAGNQLLTPSYSDCRFGELPVAVVMNNCSYIVKGNPTGSGPPFTGTLNIACPQGVVVEFRVYLNNNFTGLLCMAKVGAQTLLPGLTLATVGQGVERGVEMDAAVGAVKYETVGGFCPEPGAHTDGVIEGETILRGIA